MDSIQDAKMVVEMDSVYSIARRDARCAPLGVIDLACKCNAGSLGG